MKASADSNLKKVQLVCERAKEREEGREGEGN